MSPVATTPDPDRRLALGRLLGGALGATGGLLPGWALAASATAPASTSATAAAAAAAAIEPEGPLSSEPLAAAALWDLDDRPVRWAAVAGTQPLIVNFWARWCAPCRVEIPELVALTERRSGVKVLGLALENDPAPVRDFGRAYDINYPVLLTRGGGLELMRALGNRKAGLPFTIALDRRGAVVASRLGLLTRAHLDAAVKKALA